MCKTRVVLCGTCFSYMGRYLGKAFRELRDELGLSQSAVARSAKGISRTTVILMEHGKHVKLETLLLLLQGLGISKAQRTGVVTAWLRDCLGEELWRDCSSLIRRKSPGP